MSTRATYLICGTPFYIHHDGYEAGAATYLLNMVEASMELRPWGEDIGYPVNAYAARGGWPFAFIRGNGMAEPSEGHDAHGDTEGRYTVTESESGLLNVQAWRRRPGDPWREVWNGGLACFVNRYHDHHGSRVIIAFGGDGSANRPSYATRGQASELATRLSAFAARQGESSGGYYERMAQAWRDGLRTARTAQAAAE